MAGSGVRVGVEASVEFKGNRQVIDQLLNGQDGMVARELERRAIQVERRAKRLCAVDTGRLRASVSHRLERDTISLSALIGTNVEYAVFVEFGTSRMPAQPFLRPALVERTAT